ncbi:MAG: hypothetical protein JRI68_21930 [Deltaproteobacteria bacterium]|nr:hypothetical protein [Deltaproteobacteria bacterium]
MTGGALVEHGGSAPSSARPKRWGIGGLRLDALAACLGYRALVGLLAALPLAAAAASLIGHHPRGDQVLWEPGGLWLLEALRLAGPAFRSMAPYGSVFLLVGACGWLLPLGALVLSVGAGARGRTWPELLGQAAGRFPTLALLFGVTLLLQTLVLALVTVSAVLLAASASSRSHGADALRIAGPCLGLVLAWGVGVVQDVLRVPVLQRDESLFKALATGWELVRTGARNVLVAAAWRTALGLLTLGVAAAAGARLTGGEADHVPLVAVLHLLALAAFVWLRGSWFHWLSRRLEALARPTDGDLGLEPAPRPAEPGTDQPSAG